MNNTGIIILAAGNSSRFGKAKQLLQFNNKTLLQHVIDEAKDSGANPIVVVTGAYANDIIKSIHQNSVTIAQNDSWQQGIASGIVAGVKKVMSLSSTIENLIITVSDQPFVSAPLFRQLYQTLQAGRQHIIACNYADTLGTPVLFTQKYFDELMNLSGDEGAKRILKTNAKDVTSIEFPQGAVDIDTKEDYDILINKQKDIL